VKHSNQRTWTGCSLPCSRRYSFFPGDTLIAPLPDPILLVLTRYSTESWVIGHCRKSSFNCPSSLRLSVLIAKRAGQRIAHVEADLRSFNYLHLSHF
jgi:hypothetical protein